MIGETVGSYRLLAKLGEGGMGEVYLAEHKYIARRAAMKFLLRDLTASPEVVNRFFSEARAASLIQHPGIVEVLDCEIHTDGRAFIVMELLHGESLRGYIERNGKLDGDPAGALTICWQMTSALAAAHAQGIVHRDLKPDNAFLHVPPGRPPSEPVVKLLDFGIAKLHGAGEGATKTRTGQLLGTPLYMSPEQCRGAQQVDSRSDIYSLGCIMFELFCGRPPFIEQGFGDLIIAHVSHHPPDPVTFAPRMTPQVRQVLLRCLEKDPAARPGSVNEVSAMLVAAGAEEAAPLQSPVLTSGAASEPMGARSPVGWASPVPTTPLPPAWGGPAASPARTPAGARAPAVHTPVQAGGTRLLPTPAPTTLGGGASEAFLPGPQPKSRKKIVLVAFTLTGLTAIAAVTLWQRGIGVVLTTGAATERPVERRPPPRRVETEAADPRPPARPERARSSVRITLTGMPASAIIRVDGQLASSPLVVPAGPDMHQIAVEAEGFERWEQTIDGTTDRTVWVNLRPTKVSEQSPKAKPKHKHEKGHGSPGFAGFEDL